jgi:hypothetical protein
LSGAGSRQKQTDKEEQGKTMFDDRTVKKNLRKGLQQYQDNKNRLASMRDENGQLPEGLHDRQSELANQRLQWLATIEELKATGVLEEGEGEKLKAKFLE